MFHILKKNKTTISNQNEKIEFEKFPSRLFSKNINK